MALFGGSGGESTNEYEKELEAETREDWKDATLEELVNEINDRKEAIAELEQDLKATKDPSERSQIQEELREDRIVLRVLESMRGPTSQSQPN